MDTEPGSVQGLQLVVSDADAARAHLRRQRRRGRRGPGLPVGTLRVLQGPRRERLGRAGRSRSATRAEVYIPQPRCPRPRSRPARRDVPSIERAPAAAHAQAQRPREVLGRPVVQAPALARHGHRQQVRRDAAGVRLDLDAAAGQAPAARRRRRRAAAAAGARRCAPRRRRRRRARSPWRAAARARRGRRRRRRSTSGAVEAVRLAPPPRAAACRPRPSSSRRRRRRRRGRSSSVADARAARSPGRRSSHGCQYWLRPGTTCAGPSAPNARRGHGSGLGEARPRGARPRRGRRAASARRRATASPARSARPRGAAHGVGQRRRAHAAAGVRRERRPSPTAGPRRRG